MKKIAFIFLSFLSLNCFSQQYSKKWTNIDYADDGKSYHQLDVYLPKVVKPTYPVVVYVYGSAWFSNNLKGSDMNTVGAALLNAGYAVVTPNHRSSGDSLFPAQINDIKAVIRFIRANSSAYNLDTSFIGISGSSSGGHLAALAGTSGGIVNYTYDSITMNIEGSLGRNLNYSSKVHAVCDWFGPTDLLLMDSCRGSIAYAEGQSPEETLIGCSKKNCESKFVFINPITFIDPTDPPFLIFHGNADNVVPYCESQLLYDALQTAKVPSEFIIAPGGQHYTGTHTEANIKKMVNFFNDVSKNDITSSVPISSNENGKTISVIAINDELKIQGVDIACLLSCEIIDVKGRVIAREKINSDKVNVSCLKEGVYILKLYLKDSSEVTIKFMK